MVISSFEKQPLLAEMQDKTSLERAFEMAREGKCKTVAEVRQRLKREGFNASQVEGAALARQLSQIIHSAQSPGDSPPGSPSGETAKAASVRK